MIEINLIPDVKRELLKAQRSRSIVISASIFISIVAGGLVALLLIYILAFQTVRTLYVQGQIDSQQKELAKVEDLSQLLTIQNQLKQITTLENNKVIDSRAFDMLAAVIPPGTNAVQVSGLSIIAETTNITLQGQTATFESMEVFKKTLASAVIVYTDSGETKQVDLASDISVTEVSYGEDALNKKVVRFTLSFKYAKELFASTVPSITIKLKTNGNVTDSYLGIPKSIFTEPARTQ